MGSRPLAERLFEFLQERQLLLVLDNFEQLIAAAPLVGDLVAMAPGLKILVTSQSILRLSAEHDLAVLPLPLPASGEATLSVVAASDAVRLFLDRARASHSEFVLTAENAAIVAAICAHLDGHPLAIELAAARVGHLPLPAILERLEQRLTFLTSGPRDAPERLQTLHKAMLWSYDLLAEDERRLFRTLSVFRGGFSLDAAAAVSRSVMGGAADILETIASLVDKSLLRLVPQADEPRYRMLETVREFGIEQLAAADESMPVHLAHAEHFLALAERSVSAWWGSEPWRSLDRLETDHDNLRAALDWAGRHRADLAARLAIALHWFWRARGPVSEGRRWLETILATFQDGPPTLRAVLLARTGDLALLQGAFTEAVDLLDASIALARALGDRETLTYALAWRGAAGLHADQFDLDDRALKSAVSQARAAGDHDRLAFGLIYLGAWALRHGDVDRASTLIDEAYAVSRAHQISWMTAVALNQLGYIAALRGEFPRADALYRENLHLTSTIRDNRHLPGALAGLAWLHVARGDPEAAARICGAVEAMLDASGVGLAPTAQAAHERARTSATTMLSEAAFSAAVSVGRAMAAEAVIAELLHMPDRDATPDTAIVASAHRGSALTPREREVLRLVAQGRTNREIATILYISHRTATTHVTNILGKLGVATRTEATAWAVREHLVE
jgi:non-specific serine/threonine protein kinase